MTTIQKVIKLNKTGNIIIRLANKSDRENVLNAVKDFYLKHDPLPTSHRIKTISNAQMHYFRTCFDNGYTFLTENEDDKKLFGFQMNIIDSEERKKQRRQMESDEKIRDIWRLLDTIGSKCNVYEKYNITECFNLLPLAMNPEARQKSITLEMCYCAFQLAKNKGFRVATATCTGFYSQKIAEKIGMQCVGSVKYADFTNENGIQIFNPPNPHDSFKAYVKLL